jgi:L-threonylcarbamoyladenylate synthase
MDEPSVRLKGADAGRLQECLASGGVAILPTDTVYGIACDPAEGRAVRRIYELKGRPQARPAAVMFFQREQALSALPELGEAERGAVRALLPGPVTLLLPNRLRRFPLACPAGGEELWTIGLRVPLLGEALAALGALEGPLLQSSANLSGGSDARRLEEVPRRLLEAADLVLDGGELPGRPSSVIDLREYERERSWRIVREGAFPASAAGRALTALGRSC